MVYDKECQKHYRELHKDRIKKRRKELYNLNKPIRSEKKKEYQKQWRHENKEYLKEYNKKHHQLKKTERNIHSRLYYKTNRDMLVIKQRKYNNKMKIQIYNHYSNFNIKCNCCGESMIEFLSIDHINNDGFEHRKTVGNGTALYKWLISNNYPLGFQILCHNCNFAKGKDKDHICPHKRKIVEILLK